MRLSEICAEYEREFPAQKQTAMNIESFSAWCYQANLKAWFKDRILTDAVLAVLKKRNLEVFLCIDREEHTPNGRVELCLWPAQNHPLYSDFLYTPKTEARYGLLQIRRKKLPHGGWAWSKCEDPDRELHDDDSVEAVVKSLVRVYERTKLHKVAEEIRTLEVYDRLVKAAQAEKAQVITLDDLKAYRDCMRVFDFPTIPGSCHLRHATGNSSRGCLPDDEESRAYLIGKLRDWEAVKNK